MMLSALARTFTGKASSSSSRKAPLPIETMAIMPPSSSKASHKACVPVSMLNSG
ncbi:hypothetical protein D3C80_1695640 [compost metagenome]